MRSFILGVDKKRVITISVNLREKEYHNVCIVSTTKSAMSTLYVRNSA